MNVKSNVSMQGKVRIIKSHSLTIRNYGLWNYLYRRFIKRQKTGDIISITPYFANRIMLGTNTGKDLILDRLNADNSYTLNINYADIGTGTNTPADGDTTLQTVVSRTAKANGSISSNVLSLFFFWPTANLANGTYYEFGMFIDGTSTVSTGQIFNRVLFGTAYTKGTNEDTTVQCDITIT